MSDNISVHIKNKAHQLGFDLCGFTTDLKSSHKDYYKKWLEKGHHGDMSWLANNQDKRCDASKIKDGMQSAIVLAVNYHHNQKNDEYKLAEYAYGLDYHIWVKDMAYELATYTKDELYQTLDYRVFVDTGPIFERELAYKAGLGWIGKNTCLINKDLGSFLFLAVILTNLKDLPEAKVQKSHCGNCDRCLTICPTHALNPCQLNASQCLAYQNIEKKGERSDMAIKSMANLLLGCDLCQNVCPFNQKAPQTKAKKWLESFRQFDLGDLKQIFTIDKLTYEKTMIKSAVSRVGYFDFMRNVFIVIGNLNKKELLPFVKGWKNKNIANELKEYEFCLEKLERSNDEII